VVTSGLVFAVGRLEVALERVALVLVFAFRQVDELLVFSTGDDVAADTVVAAVTLNLSLIAVEVLPGLVDDVAVFDFRKDEALFPGTGGQLR